MQNNMQDDKKRILIFSTAYYPFVGGAEVAIKEITDRLGNDFDFDLITAKLQSNLLDTERVGNVNVYRVGTGSKTLDKILLPFRGFIMANSLAKRNNYFCMWGMMVTFGTGAGYLLNIYRKITLKKFIPIVLTLQEGDSEAHLRFKWFGLIALSWKLALSQTKVLTGISNFLLDRAKKNGYKKESYLVPNGVDLEVFGSEISDDVRIHTKELLGKKEGEIFLVTTGRLTHKNATDDIISALSKLPESISLIVIGRGDQGPDLQKQVDALGLSSRVKFLGFIPYSEIPKYFSACDIFIRPSRSEGFGNSFIEAMAAKLPVIATPVGGIPDFLTDNETGVFCSPDNPQSIVKAVNTILGDENLRHQIIENAYRRVAERYEWKNVANKMKEVFDKVSN
jgi:glycosyltransferase involved in cell wall biosynthesis